MFNKKEEIFDNLFEKDVPIFRAVWYIKASLGTRLLCGVLTLSLPDDGCVQCLNDHRDKADQEETAGRSLLW